MQQGRLNRLGRADAAILIITDAPGKGVYETGGVMSAPQMKLIQKLATEAGIPGSSVRMLTPCPNIPDDIADSEKKVGEFLAEYHAEFVDEVQAMEGVRVVLALGKTALRQLAGRPVKITEARGTFTTYPATGDTPVLPLLSPAHVLRRPEVAPVFEGDFKQLGVLRESGWDVGVFAKSIDGAHYEWCLDLQPLLDSPPARLAVDTETRGLDWHGGRKAILCVQLSYRKGHSLVLPLDPAYFNDAALRGESSKHLPELTEGDVARLIGQLKEILGNPATKVTGHNLKYDVHHLRNYGVEIADWYVDTMQLAFAADENMERKSLDECVRRWVPELAAYADEFNATTDKSRMETVPHDKMLRYAGGDTDACIRLTERLVPLVKQDHRQWTTFRRVQMPALSAFAKIEEAGALIDKDALRDLGVILAEKDKAMFKELMEEAAEKAPAVMRKHADAGLSFTRDAFVADLLFSPQGWNLPPRVFTPGTRKLPPEQRIPSVSTKEHLPFFEHVPFVKKLIEYQKLTKLRTTYIGAEPTDEITLIKRLKSGRYSPAILKAIEGADWSAAIIAQPKVAAQPVRRRAIITATPPETPVAPIMRHGKFGVDAHKRLVRIAEQEATGFWQYLPGDKARIHATFRLDNVVTGRTSSREPNFQNLPKHGPEAKHFRKVFKAAPGKVLISADLSQAELRIAAWMANEANMLRIYRDGGDIHAATGAGVAGIPFAQVAAGMTDDITLLLDVANEWKGSGHFLASLSPGQRAKATVKDYVKQIRQQAKAVNFGFLYGMWWRKFVDYAKTSYGVTFTDKQAEAVRERFFAMYPGLEEWHKAMRSFVKQHGYVRALHGALRRLPSINSSDEGIQRDTERQAINSPVQRFASDLGVMALARFTRDCPPELARVILFIHDDVTVEADEEHALEVASALKFYMQSSPLEEWFGITPPIPIVSDVSIGHNLATMDERGDIVAKAPAWFDAAADAEAMR